MSDRTLEILEQNVKHNLEDIRDLKQRMDKAESDINDLKIDSHTTKQNINHVFTAQSRIENAMDSLNNKFDVDKAERHKDQIEQLRQYKSAVWQVGIYLTCVIVGGFLLVKFGLK